MITATKRAGFFKRQNIGRLFDHAEQFDRTRGVRANIAKFVGGEVAAKVARMNSAARFGNGTCDLFGLIAASLHHPERDPFGRTRTDPRHLSKLRDQVPQRGWIFRFSHTASPMPVQRQSGSDLAPRTRVLLTSASSAFRPDSARAVRGDGDTTAAARL